MIEQIQAPPGVVLVGVRTREMTSQVAEQHVAELHRLVDTLGYTVLDTHILRGGSPHPGLFIGSGQADRLAEIAQQRDAEALVFDDELSPSQQRNLERRTKLAVADRHEIILEIFHDHAVTREARLQVEKAELKYQLPRLRRAWTHLSRQRGGTRGTRGEGETQLEIDRRRITSRMQQLETDLEEVRRHRATMRRRRESVPVPTVALVGYTNAGKSSLMSALTGAGVRAADQLFATLDPKTARMRLPNGMDLIVTDTVGFIRKLPHDLVEAFQSTLEETARADLLIHVVDASSPQAASEVSTTRSVLSEIGASSAPTLVVFNKVDLLEQTRNGSYSASIQIDGVQSGTPVSSLTGFGIEQLIERITDVLGSEFREARYRVPTDRWDLVAKLHREARVHDSQPRDDGIFVRAEVSPRVHELFQQFAVPNEA